jgi:hypothetical protein
VRSLRDATSVGSHDRAVTGERYLQRWSVTRPDFLSGVHAMTRRLSREE